MTRKSGQQPEATQLRKQAFDLLSKANDLDGRSPFAVVHQHEYGTTTYVVWNKRPPTQQEAIAALDSEFEPDKGEFLAICTMSIDDLAGTAGVESDGVPPQIQAKAKAMQSARLLVQAYANGEACGGEIDWSEVDDAYSTALEALTLAGEEIRSNKDDEDSGQDRPGGAT